MQDTKVTVASLKSIIIDPQENLQRVRQAVEVAERDGAWRPSEDDRKRRARTRRSTQ